ncbi:MAG: hypothetical protein EZS28_042303, partial [Streblomastix strix]
MCDLPQLDICVRIGVGYASSKGQDAQVIDFTMSLQFLIDIDLTVFYSQKRNTFDISLSNKNSKLIVSITNPTIIIVSNENNIIASKVIELDTSERGRSIYIPAPILNRTTPDNKNDHGLFSLSARSIERTISLVFICETSIESCKFYDNACLIGNIDAIIVIASDISTDIMNDENGITLSSGIIDMSSIIFIAVTLISQAAIIPKRIPGNDRQMFIEYEYFWEYVVDTAVPAAVRSLFPQNIWIESEQMNQRSKYKSLLYDYAQRAVFSFPDPRSDEYITHNQDEIKRKLVQWTSPIIYSLEFDQLEPTTDLFDSFIDNNKKENKIY